MIISTLRRSLRRKLRMRWFSDVSTVKGRGIFWKIGILAVPKLRLKKFDIFKEMRKMVNLKSNNGVHKVEKAWQNFPHSDWLVKIITS